MTVGDTHEKIFHYTQKDVEDFARISGDNNPLHLDPQFAATTPFKQPIMHGMLAGSIFSRLLGTEFPGPGSIYLAQSLEFLRPMHVDTEYKAILTVKEIDKDKHTAVIATEVFTVERGKITIRGEAKVQNREKI
jgi:acyl dehydratase